jgi:hypothetical protein
MVATDQKDAAFAAAAGFATNKTRHDCLIIPPAGY